MSFFECSGTVPSDLPCPTLGFAIYNAYIQYVHIPIISVTTVNKLVCRTHITLWNAKSATVQYLGVVKYVEPEITRSVRYSKAPLANTGKLRGQSDRLPNTPITRGIRDWRVTVSTSQGIPDCWKEMRNPLFTFINPQIVCSRSDRCFTTNCAAHQIVNQPNTTMNRD
jgi:hypothetical protein